MSELIDGKMILNKEESQSVDIQLLRARVKELEEVVRELMMFCTSGEAYEQAERLLRGEESR